MIHRDISDIDKIDSADSNAFSFVDVIGNFIQNNDFSNGFKKFQNREIDDHEAFIYQVLSAASDDIGQTIYDNVKRYVSYISDVDVCKVKALKSMLQLFGFKYTIFDKFDSIPKELLNLIDVLSISRKFLISDGWLKKDFVQLLSSNGIVTGQTIDAAILDARHLFKQNSYVLSTCPCTKSTREVDKNKIVGAYLQQDSIDMLSGEVFSKIDPDTLSKYTVFKNNYDYLLVDELSSCNLYSRNKNLLLKFPEDKILKLSSDGLSNAFQISSLLDDSDLSNSWFVQANQDREILVKFTSLVKENTTSFSDDAYQAFLKKIFLDVISGYIALEYNVSIYKNNVKQNFLIYKDLGSDYFYNISSQYFAEDDDFLSAKTFFHIPISFNQRKIVDDIEVGNDFLENYSGAELSILQNEISRRKKPLQLSSSSTGSSGTSQIFLQTRDSYHRKQKVLEYAKFVDNYYSNAHKNPEIYDVDPNFCVMENNKEEIPTVINQNPIGNPMVDLSWDMLDDIAEHLANMTIYIQKIREKIKQQTQKNYMKGTNLLLIYIINEYLIDYARQNKNSLIESGLSNVYASLSSHQFRELEDTEDYTIDVIEYYDSTNYNNISASTSRLASDGSTVNQRYWSKSNQQGSGLLKDDGKHFSIEDIEKFYLSTLCLNSAISGNLPNFLSTIFDIGADPTFIFKLNNDPNLSVYSSMLSSGKFVHEIYQQFIDLSDAWDEFNLMLNDKFEYDPSLDAGQQLDDAIQNSIYVDLSNSNLSDVSAVYDKNIQDIDQLSVDVDTLSSVYINFISSEYGFYYRKFESKYCYDPQDADSGEYMHPYYVENTQYDSPTMNLYEHIEQLKKYSYADGYIVNHAMKDIVEYVSAGYYQVRNDLATTVIDSINEYGFVDISASTLDNEIPYVYNFLSGLVESRLAFLKNQVATVQQQAAELRTQFDSINNTFTNAVAQFNDNNDGYSLGANCIHAVSIGTRPKGVDTDNKCTRNSSKPSGKAYTFVVKVEDYWYYCTKKDEGDYGYVHLDINPVYHSDDSLEQRCNAVVEYMNTPTHFAYQNESSSKTWFYGLRNEGIAAVADNTKASIANLEKAYTTILQMANSMFGVKIPDNAIGLQQKILALINALAEIDDAYFDADEILKKYKSFLTKTIELSAQYNPIKEAFDSIFTSNELGTYLANMIPVFDLTEENINILRRYYEKTDSKNLIEIKRQISEMFSTFDGLLSTKTKIENSMYNDGISSVSFDTGTSIEKYINRLYNLLLLDVKNKTDAANEYINSLKFKVQAYANIISNEISSNIDSLYGLDFEVSSRLQQLNFFENDRYNFNKDKFLTYGGKDFCHDQYYNMQNVVHPSYQIHPYLWNFVKKLGNDSLIQAGFQTSRVDELEKEIVNAHISKYLNQYGMAKNTWMNTANGLVDYTGYLSRYEKEDNRQSKTGIFNEVVDYDGAFYPPAIEMFHKNQKQCIESVRTRTTKIKCLSSVELLLKDVFSDGKISINEETQLIEKINFYDEIFQLIEQFTNIDQEKTIIAIDNAVIGQSSNQFDSYVIVKILDQFVEETFYEKYYQHLNLPISECERIANQLEEYKDKILKITTPTSTFNVYDIYKYGLDINGNSYILFKQYDYSNLEDLYHLTYAQKRDTLGEIWIRLADHPIAFPAFSGKNPAYFIQNPNIVNVSILSVATAVDPTGIVWNIDDNSKISEISSDMKAFYDFEFAKDKMSIAYVTYNADYEFSDIYKRFDISWVIGNQIQTYYDNKNDIEYLKIMNGNGSAVERIDFNYNSSLGQHYIGKDALDTGVVEYPALIGHYPIDDSAIDFVYLSKKYELSSKYENDTSCNILISEFPTEPEIFAVRIDSGLKYTKTNNQLMSNASGIGQKIVGDQACVGYTVDTNETVIAITTQNLNTDKTTVKPCTSNSKIDFNINADGPTIDDPSTNEMNSHDYLNQNVSLFSFKRSTSLLKFKNAKIYNLNADISYLPVYPALSNEAMIYTKWDDAEQHNLELLGMSKDIDGMIGLVNPSPDPYLDYEKVVENSVFGRVYEDYNAKEDKTFRLISNPSLNLNSPKVQSSSGYQNDLTIDVNLDSGIIEYQINLDKTYTNSSNQYTERDFEHLKVLVYNINTLGKNPYLMCDLTAITQEEQELFYNSNQYLNEFKISANTMTQLEYYGIGTHSDIDLVSKIDSNHISNIKKITCKYDSTALQKILVFKFYIENKSIPVFIPSKEFSVLLTNPNDLTMFKYYHLFDAYGILNAKSPNVTREIFKLENNNPNQGWNVYYGPTAAANVKNAQSYFEDVNGLDIWLKDIQLENYDYLSDIYIFQGYEGLGFKYDEELKFSISSDLYYYPTMNLAYPKQAGDIVDRGKLTNRNSALLSILTNIYNEKNLFVINLLDPIKIANKIGQVAIPILINDIDDIRAYEDWNDVSTIVSESLDQFGNKIELSSELTISQIYDVDDPRSLAWARYNGNEFEISPETSSGFEITDDSSYIKKSTSQFLNYVDQQFNLKTMTSEDLTSDYSVEYTYVNVNSTIADLSKILKLYVNYKKNTEDNSIKLYFNYFNWFDSPYVKIENNKMYVDTIEGTYLKLDSGEDGLLDIVMQIRYYNGGQLYGYRNLKIASYHIWNISDDKPKFIVKKVFEIENNSSGTAFIEPNIVFDTKDVEIDLKTVAPSYFPSFELQYTIRSNVDLIDECDFYISYPENIFEIESGQYANVKVENDENGFLGIKHVFMTNIKHQNNKIPVKSRLDVQTIITKYKNLATMIQVVEQKILDSEKNEQYVNISDWNVSFSFQ